MKAKKVLTTLLLVVLFTGTLFADGKDPKNETGKVSKISGQVIDQLTGETLAGVKVFIPGTDKAVYTDFDGEFQIECNLNTETEIAIALISYEGKTIKLEESISLEIKLERQK